MSSNGIEGGLPPNPRLDYRNKIQVPEEFSYLTKLNLEVGRKQLGV